MEVTLIRDNPDGSADIEFNLAPEEREIFLRIGIIEALKASLVDGKKYVPQVPALFKEKVGGAD